MLSFPASLPSFLLLSAFLLSVLVTTPLARLVIVCDPFSLIRANCAAIALEISIVTWWGHQCVHIGRQWSSLLPLTVHSNVSSWEIGLQSPSSICAWLDRSVPSKTQRGLLSCLEFTISVSSQSLHCRLKRPSEYFSGMTSKLKLNTHNTEMPQAFLISAAFSLPHLRGC